jgi:hypothetical protein
MLDANPGARPRVLFAGVYLADIENTAAHVTDVLSRSTHLDIEMRWIALTTKNAKTDVPGTVAVVRERTPKCVLINRLLEKFETFDWVILCDDDVEIAEGFADALIAMADYADFALLQPARTLDSYIDHPIVGQFPGLLARQTHFVEIGPVVCLRRDAARLLLPFSPESAMGWGLDLVWPQRIESAGLRMGVIDAVPVAHRIRAPVTGYNYDAANAEMSRVLAANPHLEAADAMQILQVF